MNVPRLTRRRLLSLLPAAGLAGCTENEPPPGPKFPRVPWRILSTTHFTADLVRVVGGEAVDSQCFLPPAVSPHAFVPAAPDLMRFHTADMVMRHGLDLENRWPEDFDELARNGVRVFCVTSTIPSDRILRPSGPTGSPDPHVWTDPGLVVLMVDAIEAALKEVMPALADYFAARAHKLRVEFRDLMEWTAGKMQELSADDRFLLTSHDSMRYFAAAFQLEARALTAAGGSVPDALPEELSEWIRAHNVKSLFREPFTEVVALRALLKDVKVNPDHVIYSLALPAAGSTAIVTLNRYEVALAAGSSRNNADEIQFTLRVD